jgi:hypothetical protein
MDSLGTLKTQNTGAQETHTEPGSEIIVVAENQICMGTKFCGFQTSKAKGKKEELILSQELEIREH